MTSPEVSLINQRQPVIFEEFFELGQPETISPFITKDSRYLGKNLTLKSSILAAILLIFTFALSFHPSTLPLSQFLLVGVYFLAGIPALIESIEDLMNFQVNIDVLMILAAFSSVLIGSGMEGGLLLVLFSISGAMEDAVRAKAKGAISSLHKLSPTRATVVLEDGTLLERSVKDIAIQTLILVKSGQIVPLDGIVTEGTTSVNMVHITGENFPIKKGLGDEIPAGARNLEGAVVIKVTRSAADSTLTRIIQLVTQAQEARPKLQRWFDKVSDQYAKAIILLAAIFTITFPWLLGIPFSGTEGSFYRALAFLIAASPCALIIAIPIAYLSAVSVCARKGIIIKGGITLDAIADSTAVVLDKTGTLTTGELTCEGIEAINGTEEKDLTVPLAIATALEKNAVHPIARAVVSYGEVMKVSRIVISDFKSISGYGLEGKIFIEKMETFVYIGHPEYILSQLSQESQTKVANRILSIQSEGKLVAVLLIGQELYLLKFRDTPRAYVNETLTTLRKVWNLKTIMLTGDHENNARRIATELGIEDYQANLKPEDKLYFITELTKKEKVMMVGDGINDAPALARAHVGICMGKVGSTPALDASDVILLRDNIEFLDWLVAKAHKTKRIVRENLIIAAGAILVATLPALGGLIPLWLAVILHEGGTVLVGLNALRLLRNSH